MKPIRTLIIDDEPAAIEVIATLAAEFTPDILVSGTASNGLKALQLINELQPELVFLDIDMPGLNGLQLLEQQSATAFLTIVTTGSSSHALQALKLSVVDYLLKPIDVVEFITSVDKVRQRMRQRGATGRPSRKIQLPTQNEIVLLDEAQIIKVEGMGSYCQIYTTTQQKLVISKSIGAMQQKLSAEMFFRCHNSYIINLDFIEKLVSKDGFFAVLKDGSFVEVSRRLKEAFLEKLAYAFDFQ